MRVGPLLLWERCKRSDGSEGRSRVLAAWHWPRSSTWRWSLWWTPADPSFHGRRELRLVIQSNERQS